MCPTPPDTKLYRPRQKIKEIRAQLINRPKSKWVPFVMIDEDPIDPSNIIRQVRRLIQKGNQVAQSVSRGEFPGRSRLK